MNFSTDSVVSLVFSYFQTFSSGLSVNDHIMFTFTPSDFFFRHFNNVND